MVGRKQAIFLDTVPLLMTGPKFILPEAVLVQAKLNHTWLQLFNVELQLEVPPDSGVFVCTSRYTPSSPKAGEGWRSELHTPISQFVNKFQRNKKQYSVRICNPTDIANYTKNVKTPGTSPNTPTTSSGNRPVNKGKSAGPRRPVPGAKSHNSASPRRPTQGIIAAAPTAQNGNYSKPRYHNANGIPHTPPGSRSQQLHYGTRQKRIHDETLREVTICGGDTVPQTGRVTSPLKRPRNINPENGQQGTKAGTGSRACQKIAPKIDNIESIVKVEPVAVPIYEEECGPVPRKNCGEAGIGFPNNVSDNESGDDDDDASLCTALTAEHRELRQQGIQVEDIKSLAEGRFNRFSNAYMLRVRNEIRKLRKSNRWGRNVTRAPLSCYMLTEIFKE